MKTDRQLEKEKLVGQAIIYLALTQKVPLKPYNLKWEKEIVSMYDLMVVDFINYKTNKRWTLDFSEDLFNLNKPFNPDIDKYIPTSANITTKLIVRIAAFIWMFSKDYLLE